SRTTADGHARTATRRHCGRHASENSHSLCAGGCTARGTAAAGACTHSRDSDAGAVTEIRSVHASPRRAAQEGRGGEPEALIRWAVPRLSSPRRANLKRDIFVGNFRAVAWGFIARRSAFHIWIRLTASASETAAVR